MKKKLLSLIFIFLLSNVSFAVETLIEVIPLYNRPASEIQPLISPMLESTDRVIAGGSNLIVKTTHDRLEEIKTFRFITPVMATLPLLLQLNLSS